MDIEKKRAEIDEIDAYMTKLFLRRMQICGEIGHYKKYKDFRVYDEEREKEIFARVKSMTPTENMREYTELLYETVIGLANAYQLEIRNED